jgi:hypothetical protein
MQSFMRPRRAASLRGSVERGRAIDKGAVLRSEAERSLGESSHEVGTGGVQRRVLLLSDELQLEQ